MRGSAGIHVGSMLAQDGCVALQASMLAPCWLKMDAWLCRHPCWLHVGSRWMRGSAGIHVGSMLAQDGCVALQATFSLVEVEGMVILLISTIQMILEIV